MGERSFSKSWGLRASGSFIPLPLPRPFFFFCSRPNFLDEHARKRLLRRLICCFNMALISFRLFRKNLSNLPDFFGQMVYRPPLAKKFPYAYENKDNNTNIKAFPSKIMGQCPWSHLYSVQNIIYYFSAIQSHKPRKMPSTLEIFTTILFPVSQFMRTVSLYERK